LQTLLTYANILFIDKYCQFLSVPFKPSLEVDVFPAQKLRFLIVALTLLIAPLVSPITPVSSYQTDHADLLAAATGSRAEDLSEVEASTVTLLDGQEILRLKAYNYRTNEIVGADFNNGQVVDYTAMATAAGKQWREQHGALPPASVAALADLAAEDRVNVAVWLAVQVESLPRPERAPQRLDFETSTSTAAEDLPYAPPSGLEIDGKPIVQPLPASAIPAEVRSLLANRSSGENLTETPKTAEEIEANRQAQIAALPSADSDAEINAFKVANDAHIRAQIAPARAQFLQKLEQSGLRATYASEMVPMAYLPNLTRAEVEKLAFWPEIDAIYIVPDQAGPSLNYARTSQNAHLINNVGYNGSGVNVSVTEGERAFFANPYLTLDQMYDGSKPYAAHPTAVAGFIRSTFAGYQGLANAATVDSANGSYSDFGVMSAAMDWGSTNNTVLNNSWYWDSSNNPSFWAADRHQDYFVRYNYDFVTVAAGNFGNGCGSNFSSYVVSPAKGYNVMSVGNYDDLDTIGWTGDVMDVCSSFGDPANDGASVFHAKPEVSAIGSGMSSTLTNASAPYVGAVGSGTSYAAPMVAALAADLIQAVPAFGSQPEVLRALIMATALHNIEGSSRYSDVDGAGGIDASAALASAERGNYASTSISASTTYPITYTQFAYAGERVRFAISWLSNPTSDYTSDPLPVDLDLTAFRADGTTFVAGSSSSTNNFEIVDFIAPASETYQFKVTKFGSYSGSSTWLGAGWWRGVYRISPNTGYGDPKAPPLGTHLVVYPSSWIPSNYWRAMGVRSLNSDHDLYMTTASEFDDPATRTQLAASQSGFSDDIIVVDGNHWNSSWPEHYQIKYYGGGSGGYNVGWSNQSIVLYLPGSYGPYTMSPSQVVEVYDLYINTKHPVRISIVPTSGNASDLAVYLYQSDPATQDGMVLQKWEAVEYSDLNSAPSTVEQFSYLPSTNDLYGLVVSSKTANVASYYIVIEWLNVYMPGIMR
jgi:hypothetical protein